MRKLLLIIGACLALFVVAGCGSDDSTTSSSPSDSTEEASAPKETESSSETESTKKKTKPTTVNVPSGGPPKQLVIRDVETGTGPAVKTGDVVKVNYLGVNFKTGKEFDSSWSRGEPIAFPVGENVVIQGWEKGLKGMKAGGRRELIVPPDLGYGAAGQPPAIPPNETLVFVIDLESIEAPTP